MPRPGFHVDAPSPLMCFQVKAARDIPAQKLILQAIGLELKHPRAGNTELCLVALSCAMSWFGSVLPWSPGEGKGSPDPPSATSTASC